MLVASGRHGILGLALLLDALVNIALSIWLAVTIGPVGVALSSAVTLAAVHLVVIPAIAVRRLGLSGVGLVQALLGGAVFGSVVVGVIALIPAQETIGLVVRGLVALGGGVALLLLDQAGAAGRLNLRSGTPRGATPRSPDREGH